MNDLVLDQDMISGFLDEAGQHIATLNERLLAVEQSQVGPEAVAEMFRAAHSLKGAAGFLKFDDLAMVTHRMESVFDQVRHGQMTFTGPVVDALFQSFDLVSSLLADVANGITGQVDSSVVLALLDGVLGGVTATHEAPTPQPAKPAAAQSAPTSTAPAKPVAAAKSAKPVESAKLVESATPTTPPTAAKDPIEEHLGVLPDWLRGKLEEKDAFEGLLAIMGGSKALALRFDAGDLLRAPAGASGTLAELMQRMKIQRVLPLIDGPADLWAPLREYQLHIGVLAFCDGDPAAVLKAAELPAGTSWVLSPDGVQTQPIRFGRDLAAADRRSERLIVKSDMAQHRAMWLTTTREVLAELDGALLALERDPGQRAQLDQVFRYLHTLKGSCASMGLDEMARLAHQGESLLAAARDERLVLETEAIADLFSTKDLLQTCTDRVEAGDERAPQTAELDASLGSRLNGAGIRPGLPAWTPTETDLAAARAVSAGKPVWKLRLVLTADAPLADLRYGMILGNLGKIATIAMSKPSLAELERGIANPPSLCALIVSEAPLKELIEAISCDHLRDWSFDPVVLPEPPKETVSDKPAAANGEVKAGVVAADTVRVDTARLDHLLNTAGELVITKARLTQQIDTLVRLLDGVDVRSLESLAAQADGRQTGSLARLVAGLGSLRRAQDEVHRTRDTTLELHRHTSAMQNSVMQARMVPIGPLFQRFNRLIRDLCKENGREAVLAISGESTELDKKLIDEIGDPLTHLIRNGVDHGLESPEERVAAGKPRQGTVHLEAFHRSGMICIQVRDDGRGLVVDKIRSKAVERGLVTAEAASRLEPAEIFQFIFLPGFSTAAKVTSISGRGVGMDIVKSKVTALKGKIDIASEPGKGATFTISLPLTLAMIESLLVRIGEGRFAFPLDCVREIVEVRNQDVRTVEGKGKVIFLRDQVISLIDLNQVVGIGPLSHHGEVVRAVVTKGGGETLAISVDQVIGDEEIVVKPLGQEFAHVRGLSGATVLGDGGVALILDTHGIHDLSRNRRGPGRKGA